MFAKPSIAGPRVRVRHTAEEPDAKDKERKLHRGHTDDQRHSDEPQIGDGVFKNMGSVIGPKGQLLFCMMQGVDPIPPANPVRDAVTPVVGEIENGKVGNKDGCGP